MNAAARLTLLIAVTVPLCVPLSAAFADPPIFEYTINLPNSSPVYVAVTPHWDAWFNDVRNNVIGFVPYNDLTTYEFPLVPNNAAPLSISNSARSDRDAFITMEGDVWFTEFGSGKLGTIDRSGTMTETSRFSPAEWRPVLRVPPPGDQHASITPLDVIVRPDGAVWFTEPTRHRIGRYMNGNLTFYHAPTMGAPLMLASGPDGSLWFTETVSGWIGKFENGTFAEFTAPNAAFNPISIDKSVLFDTIMPARLAVRGDGTVYFTKNWPIASGDSQIGKLDKAGKIRYLQTPTANAGPADVTIGPDGDVWFTEYRANKIGHIDASDVITEIPLPTANSGPLGIGATQDRAIFAEHKSGKIGILRWGIIPRTRPDPAVSTEH